MAAGRGIAVVEAVRRERGYPDSLVNYYDWVRRDTELDDEWTDRNRWREYFDDRLPDDHDLEEERLAEIREREIDRRIDVYLSGDEIERRGKRGQERLLEHIDDDLILEATRELTASTD